MTFWIDRTHSLALAELSALNRYVRSSVTMLKDVSSLGVLVAFCSVTEADTAYCKLIRFRGKYSSAGFV
jgi:hypothetical protein